MAKYRKKPVVIEAILFEGYKSYSKICDMVELRNGKTKVDDLLISLGQNYMEIETLEGVMSVSLGDYVILGVDGECYPCKPDIFDKTYEPVDQ